MEDEAEFYLASVWKYHDAGVSRVLDCLRTQHPSGHYAYEKANSWFSVRCSPADVHIVQAIFREAHIELEQGLSSARSGGGIDNKNDNKNDGKKDNPWLRIPSPNELTQDTSPAATTAAPAVDHLCPVAFDRFPFNKVWARVKTETPENVTVQSFLGDDNRHAIMALSGAHIELHCTGRLVFLGGPTQDALERASRMLDHLFRKFVFVMPPPKHLLWAESEESYTVDARFMAHVNDGMLSSSIFDPGQYPGPRLDDMFEAVFDRAACLRICFRDRGKHMQVSYFGPRSQPIFNDQARRWPMWFKRAEYTPKVKGVTAPPKEDNGKGKGVSEGAAGSGQQQQLLLLQQQQKQQKKEATKALERPREKDLPATDIPLMEGETDLLSLAVKPYSAPLAAPLTATATPPLSSSPSPSPSMALVPVLDLDADKHGYQLRLLQQFLKDPFKKSGTGSNGRDSSMPAAARPSASKADKAKPAKEETLVSFSEDEEPLIETSQAPAAAPAVTRNDQQDDCLLIDIEPPPTQPQPAPVARPASPRATMAAYMPSNSRALIRRTTFANSLCNHIGRLMGDLPYSRGRIRMQVEIGRIYIMDTMQETLARNMPGEPAAGWEPAVIASRLDTGCVAPDKIVFSKALTLFANDIESILGMSSGANANANANTSTNTDTGPELVDVQSDAPPEWTFHDKRIVYELKCERRVVDKTTGVIKVHSPFVVEIDGTMPGAFTYSLRSVDDNRSPIWVHCIRRSWDARVAVSYSQTEQLEAEYGEFARELLQSMVVPLGPMTSPRFQLAYDHAEKKRQRQRHQDGQSVFSKVLSARVRNVGRFASADGASYLDVSWNRHMTMEAKPGKNKDKNNNSMKGTLYFTGAEDSQARGMFGSWYEASVVSAAAEQGFRENETLAVGAMAGWGQSAAAMDSMYEAAFGPALRLVQRMDGVGVLIDNGQGDGRRRMPAMGTQAAAAVKNFW